MKNFILLFSLFFSLHLNAQNQKRVTAPPVQTAGSTTTPVQNGNAPGVVNPNFPDVIISDDYTPTGPTTNSPTKKASLTIVSFENSDFQRLVQNAHNLYGLAFEGYDKSVLLKNVYNDFPRPDRHVSNTSEASFFNELIDLADDGYMIDLFVFSHGSDGAINIEGHEITASEIVNELGTGSYAGGKFPLRMVWQINCYGETMNDAFITAGAKAVCGARFVNFYCNQFNRFIYEWNRGHVSFQTALNRSNTSSSRTVMQSAILVDAAFRTNFQKCFLGYTVLGSRPCAESYFTANWIPSDWQTGMSGKENMNFSSRMIIRGDRNITKNDDLVW